MKAYSTLRYVLIALVVLSLAGLLWWYLLLKQRGEAIEVGNTGRGAGLSQPFGAPTGSTYENIISSLTTLVVGDQTNGNSPSRLAQIGKTPTAGFGFVGSASTTRVRLVERGTGYVFDVDPVSGSLKRVTNTLIPRTYEALVANSGRVVLRGLNEQDVVVTIAGEMMTSTSTSQNPVALSQKQLSNNIRSMDVRPDGGEVFYIADSSIGAVGIRAAWDGSKEATAASLTTSGWQIHWGSNDRLVLVQNAADNVSGNAYSVEADGVLTPIVRGVLGLTLAPDPHSPAILYGQSAGTLSLFARIDDSSAPVALPIRTVADKCAWAPAQTDGPRVAYCAVPQTAPPADFLDRWYRGEVHTRDVWWRVEVNTGVVELLYSPDSTIIDVEDPVIDAGGNYIAFRNAIDKSLWLLRISK